MASTFSPNLRIELIGAGEQAGTWGTTTNTNLGTLVEDAIAGYTAVTISSVNQALTSVNGAADQSRNAIVEFTAAPANFSAYAPPESKLYTIANSTSFTATIFNSTALGNTTPAGAGVAIPAGKVMTVWSDGTDFAFQNTHIVGTVVGNVTGNVTGNLTGNVTGNVTGNAGTVTNGVTTVGNQSISGNKTFTGTTGIGADWTLAQSGSSLVFSYQGTAKFALSSAGAITAVDNITAYGTV